MIKEKIGASGKFDIYVNGKLEASISNRLMNAVLDDLAECYQGTAPDLEIKYLALGTGNTAVTNSDTTLDTEIFRTPVTSQTKTGTGAVQTDFVVLDSEAVASIEEVGIFGGASATASADTGVLISRILWSKVKTNSEELNIVRTDTISRAQEGYKWH